jgi:2-C-methyl-D-erythritol 2,4-cyclodiphosphate synthase
LPDIGQLFPDTEAAWKDADSWHLLRAIGERARESGWRLVNADAVVVAQRPKIAPFVPQMRERIASALDVGLTQINVRGKTAEGLDDAGAGLGIVVHAVCLVAAL